MKVNLPTQKKLLIATGNVGKVRELGRLVENIPIQIVSLLDFSNIKEVEENGATFDANARLKASGYALQTGMTALADDSGLEVRALGGRPGVLSARYGGESKDFAAKMELLLLELDKAATSDRAAQFVCSIAVASPTGKILHTSTGTCKGTIALNARGNNGFGYDPIFVPDGFKETFGELSEIQKQKISHRFRAFEQIIPFLRDFTAL